MKSVKFESSKKNHEVEIDLIKAKSRMSLRKDILASLERERLENRSEIGIETGPSLIKSRSLEKDLEKEEFQDENDDGFDPNMAEEDTSSNRSFFQNMMASSKKITKATKNIISEIVDTVKSYSQKKIKKESHKRNRNFFVSNEYTITFGDGVS